MRSPRPRKAHAHHQCIDADERVGALYELYAPRIASYALRRTTRADAGDVVAETFLVAWRRRQDIPDEPMALPWLYGVARRVLANQTRARYRRTRLHDRLNSQFNEHKAVGARIEAADGFERVLTALDKLSDEDAEVLRLTGWEALSPCEIASVMDIKPEAVRQRLHRARKRLRKQLVADSAGVGRGATNGGAFKTAPQRTGRREPISGHIRSLGLEGGGTRG